MLSTIYPNKQATIVVDLKDENLIKSRGLTFF